MRFLLFILLTTMLVSSYAGSLAPLTVCKNATDSASRYGSCGCPSNVQGGTGCSCSSSPSDGFDAPGLIYRSYADAGFNMPKDLANQYTQGGSCHKTCSPMDTSNCVIGDLFFSCKWGNCPDHVSIYLGDNQIAECSNSNSHCHITTPTIINYYGCRRICSENSTEVEEDFAVDDLYDDEEDDEYDLLVGTGRAVDPRRAQSTSGGASTGGSSSGTEESTWSSSSTASSGSSDSSSGASTGSGSSGAGRAPRRANIVDKSHSRSWSSQSSGGGARVVTYSSVSTIAEDEGRTRRQRKINAMRRKLRN